MKQLPNEILIKIFLLLDCKDNVELLHVCHGWNELIKKYTLFNTLDISSQSTIDKVKRQIKEKTIIASTIQKLIVDVEDDITPALDELYSLLPRLQILASLSFSGWSHNTDYPWRTSIQYITDKGDTTPLSLNVLSFGICPHLSTLSVTLEKNKQVIHLLGNAPALKDLAFHGGTLNFNNLDTIHSNTPHLEAFALDWTMIKNIGFVESIDHPTTSLDRLGFTGYQFLDIPTKRNLLVYICKKYPNLAQLKLDLEFDYHPFTLQDEALKDAWLFLFRTLSPRLKRWVQNLEDKECDGLFEILDASGCRLEHLTLHNTSIIKVGPFMHSQQTHHIQTLVIDKLYHPTFTWLKQFKVLQDLTLCPEDSHVTKFNDILANAPPSLRSLTLKNYHLAFDRKYTDTSPIQKLSFVSVRFPPRMDIFIDQHFPKLTTLEVDDSSLGKTWHLSSTSLPVLQLVLYFGTEFNVLVKTCNESRVYCLLSNAYTMEPSGPFNLPFKTFPAKQKNIEPDFTLHCHSLGTLFFKQQNDCY
jgi:hypothetical protein